MKCAKQKNHVLFPQLLLRKKAAEELKKEQERKAAERRKVKRRLFDYIVSQFSIAVECVFIRQWLNVFFGQVIDERCGQPKDLESASEGEYSADQAVTSCDTPSRPSQHQPPPPKKLTQPIPFPGLLHSPWPFLPPFMSNITDFVLACSCPFLSLRIRPLLSLLTAALVCRRAGANLQRVSFKSLQTGGGQVGPGEGH